MAEANNFTLSSSFLKQVYLYDWWLIKVETGDGSKRLGVGGFTAKEESSLEWKLKSEKLSSMLFRLSKNILLLEDLTHIHQLKKNSSNIGSSVLFGLSRNVVELVLDPPKMYCLWLIRHIPIYIFKESEQLRMSFVYDNGVRASLCVDCSNRRPDGRVFHSTTIAKRHDTTTLVTEDGITILLSGFINRCRTLQNGFSSEVCKQFLLGFPYNWEESAAVSFGESTNENAASRISDFSESANASADCTSSSFTLSVDHLSPNVLRDLLISAAGDPEGGMLRKSIFNEIVQKYGNNAFNVDEASSLNQKSGNQVTPQSPSLNGSPSQKKKAKTNRKQEDSCIADAKSGKEKLPEATPKDMPEKRVLDRLLHRSGDDVPIVGENSCLNQKSGNQVSSRGPSLDETPYKKKKTRANLRKEDDKHVPNAQCRKEVLPKCNDESGTDIDKNSSSSSALTRDKASLYKKTKIYLTQEEKRDVHKVSGQGDFGIVNITNSSNGPLTRSRAKMKRVKEQGQEGHRYL